MTQQALEDLRSNLLAPQPEVNCAALARQGDHTWPLWLALCRQQMFNMGQRPRPPQALQDGHAWAMQQDRVFARLLGGPIDWQDSPADVQPSADAHRCAQWAAHALCPDLADSRVRTESLSDELLVEALRADQVVPDRLLQSRHALTLPVLLVGRRLERLDGQLKTKDRGLIARLRVWRVPTRRNTDALRFHRAPGSRLLQLDQGHTDANGVWISGFAQDIEWAEAALRRHIRPDADTADALVWDLLPPLNEGGPPNGGGLFALQGPSAGAAFAVAAMAAFLPHLKTDYRASLGLVHDWGRVAVSAALVGSDLDGLAPVGGLEAKLVEWFRQLFDQHRPPVVHVAQGQEVGQYTTQTQPHGTLLELAWGLARDGGGRLGPRQEALYQHLLDMPVADEATDDDAQPQADPVPDDGEALRRRQRLQTLVEQVAQGREAVHGIVGYLVQCYAHWAQKKYGALDAGFVRIAIMPGRTRPNKNGADLTETDLATSLQQLLQRPGTGADGWLLVAQPGAGKTTVMRHHQLCSAHRGLQRLSQGLPLEELCVWVPLLHYNASSADPQPWLEQQFSTRYGREVPLATLMQSYPVRFLVDGINEIGGGKLAGDPSAHPMSPTEVAQVHTRLVNRWATWASRRGRATAPGEAGVLPPVFSVRTLELTDSLSRSDEGFHVRQAGLQRWSDEDVRAYCHKHADEGGRLLLRALDGPDRSFKTEGFRKFLRLPMNLALQCEVVAKLGRPARHRAELYCAALWLRLKQALASGRSGLRTSALLSDGDRRQLDREDLWTQPGYLLRPPAEGPLLRWLDRVAFALHLNDQGRDVDFDETWLARLLADEPNVADLKTWVACLQHIDLLDEGEEAKRLKFAHQTWLELFTSRGLDGPGALAALKLEPPALTALAEARAQALKDRKALPLPVASVYEESVKLGLLLAGEPESWLNHLREKNLALAGRAAGEWLQHQDESQLSAGAAQAVQALRLALHKQLTTASVDVRERLEAGLALGLVGDRVRYREEMGCLLPNRDHWVTVHGGKYKVGSETGDRGAYAYEQPPVDVHLASYHLAFAPVTNAEYSRFIEAGGYKDPRWWGNGLARTWLDSKEPVSPRHWNNPGLNNPLQPCLATLWEAMAYAAWLTAECSGQGVVHEQKAGRLRFRLCTEAEYEVAARGTKGDRYPWGNEAPSPEHCNFAETRLETTSPVGAFPKGYQRTWNPEGRGPGLVDLTGNTKIWTLSRFTNRPDAQALTTPLGHEVGREVLWGMRGSGCTRSGREVRAAFRRDGVPEGDYDGGFRLVASAGPT